MNHAVEENLKVIGSPSAKASAIGELTNNWERSHFGSDPYFCFPQLNRSVLDTPSLEMIF